MPPWGWALTLLGGSVVLQLCAATVLVLTFGPKRLDSPPLCQANLRQLGRAFSLYVQDNDGRYPPAPAWMDATTTLARDDSVYHCPNLKMADIFAYGYSFNRTLGQGYAASVSAPGQTAIVYDSSRVRRNANDAVTSLPDPPRHRSQITGMDGMVWGNNVGYADGHAAFMPNRGNR